MLKIKLVRVGKKKQPLFRIAVMPDRSKMNGRYLDLLGYYNPKTCPSLLKLDKAKFAAWVKKGAQPTQSLKFLMKKIP